MNIQSFQIYFNQYNQHSNRRRRICPLVPIFDGAIKIYVLIHYRRCRRFWIGNNFDPRHNEINIRVGAFSEYFVKMEMTMYGFQVYSSEVDDRGIDFVVRYENGPYISIQVKSIREKGYVFMQKSKFNLSSDLYMALAILHEGIEPKLFLIPSKAWENRNALLVDRDYEGKKSKPEYGLNLSIKNMGLLEEYSFTKIVEDLKKQ